VVVGATISTLSEDFTGDGTLLVRLLLSEFLDLESTFLLVRKKLLKKNKKA
jgi:hypothetical protein